MHPERLAARRLTILLFFATLALPGRLALAHDEHARTPSPDPVLSRFLPSAIPPPLARTFVPLGRERYYLANDDHSDYMWSGLDSTYRSAFVRMMNYSMDLADATAGNPWDARGRFVMDGTIWMREYEASQPPAAFARVVQHLRDSSLVVPLNACVQNWGAMPTEAVLRSFYPAGHLERRFGIRIPLVIPMENQTLPGGVASLWAGSGARWAWKGICDCASCISAADRALDAYWFTGPDGQSVLLKWNAAYNGNRSLGGYAEARNPPAVLDFMKTNTTYRTRWPYGVHGAFGYGWDDLQSFTTAFVDAALTLSDDSTRVITSNELDFFADFEDLYGGSLPSFGKSFGNDWEILSAFLAAPTALYKTSVEKLRTAEALASLVVQQDTTFMAGRTADRDSAMLSCGLYVEHSWGPGPGVTEAQRAAWQRQIARAIARYVDDLQDDGLVRLGKLVDQPGGGERHAVFNALSWGRTDVVDLVSDVPAPRRVIDVATGAELPSQSVTVDGQPRLRVRVGGVPSVGYRVVEVLPGAGGAFPPAATIAGSTMNGAIYSLTLGTRGQITALIDHKDAGRHLEYPNTALHDLGPASGNGTVVSENVGPVSATLRLVGVGLLDHDVRVTLFSGIDRVDIDSRITENFGSLPADYLYDFDVPGGKYRSEEVGMIARAARAATGGDFADQNTRTDWLTGNHFVDYSNTSHGVTLSTWDGMFWHPGDSQATVLDTTNTWMRALVAPEGTCAEAIRNQAGDSFFRNRFALRSHGPWNGPESMRFALEHQNPLVAARVTSAPGTGALPADLYSLITVDTTDVMLWALKPAEDGPARRLVARLWNLADAPRTAAVASPVARIAGARRVTHIETDIEPATVWAGALVEPFARQQLRTFAFTLADPKTGVPATDRTGLRLAVWPNPARGAGARTVSFTLASAARTSVRVLDVRGAVMRTLADGAMEPGEHTLRWSDDGLAPGVYFVRVERAGRTESRRVVVLR